MQGVGGGWGRLSRDGVVVLGKKRKGRQGGGWRRVGAAGCRLGGLRHWKLEGCGGRE